MSATLLLVVISLLQLHATAQPQLHWPVLNGDPPFIGRAPGMRGVYWPNPENITVCWQTAGFSRQKALVRSSVNETWSKYSKLTFAYWGDCHRLSAASSPDIRIRVDGHQHPHTRGLGTQLRDDPEYGMMLSFTFEHDDFALCRENRNRTDWCIRMIAVHEFGHAIGFAHEQSHPDAPAWCTHQHSQGTVGNDILVSYDPNSVMNYCNPKYSNGGLLSVKDKLSIQKIYCGRSMAGKCHNGSRCVPFTRCDRNTDCTDGSDERGCPRTTTSRPCSGFKCSDGSRCIKWSWRCDGESDCSDSSDETGCTTTTVPATTQPCNGFKCEDGSKCISRSWRCDGDYDCRDHSDETGCTTTTATTTAAPCMELSCDGGRKCIPFSWRCDGFADCDDQMDERMCTTTPTPPPHTGVTAEAVFCRLSSNVFHCHDGSDCFPVLWQCDGHKDCSDGSDEDGCP